MSASEILPDPCREGTPGRVIRGPWGEPEPAPAPDHLAPEAEAAHRAYVAEQRRQRAAARRERQGDGVAARRYQSIALMIHRARTADVVDVTDAVLEYLAALPDGELRDVLRQHLAGHRAR